MPRWPFCHWERPNRITCICPTAPIFLKPRRSPAALRGGPSPGAAAVMLPAIPYGTDTNQLGFPLAINLNPSTLLTVIRDIVDSLAAHGIHKLVILNSHGGNDFKPVLRELYGKTPVRLFLCEWYRMAADVEKEIFSTRDDHAGEVETSLALAYFPELVARDPQTGKLAADEGAVEIDAFRGRRPRLGHDHATVALADDQFRLRQSARCHRRKGRALMEVLVERISGFLVELAAAEIDDKFPF